MAFSTPSAPAMGPDLDLLFGEACEAPKVHPALLSAVQGLAAEAWPRAREELGTAAQRLDAALHQLAREDYVACGVLAEAVRAEAWQQVMREKGFTRHPAGPKGGGTAEALATRSNTCSPRCWRRSAATR